MKSMQEYFDNAKTIRKAKVQQLSFGLAISSLNTLLLFLFAIARVNK